MSVAVHAFLLPSGETALVDESDVDLVESYRWFALVCRHTTYVYGYQRGGPSNVKRVLHRVLLNPPAHLDVDHINRRGLDNRRSNLRVCTRSQNNGNTIYPLGPSGYRGVSWHKQRNKWRAAINLGHRQRHLGLFDDAWDAAQAYNVAAVEQWGAFAPINERAAS